MSLQLPTGSSHSIELINKVERKKLARISKRILDSLPINNSRDLFTTEEVQKFTESTGFTVAEFSMIVGTLVTIWKQITYHQFKPDELEAELSKLNFGDETAGTINEVWLELGPGTCNRLRNFSRSGVPELLGTEWYLKLERANRFELVKREPKVQLKLKTDQGDKFEELNFEQLKELHFTLQKIQNKVDSLMQS